MSNKTTETITCQELQQSLRRFCELKGIKVRKTKSLIACKMPSGALLGIYNNLCRSLDYDSYGVAIRPWNRLIPKVHFDTRAAVYLKKRLDENIKQLETKD